MDTLDVVLGIILLVAAVFLTIAVLMQSGKSKKLSGAISGSADTFFGKTKGKTGDRLLSKLTTVVAVVFALLVIIVYIIQDNTFVTKDNYIDDYLSDLANEDVTSAENSSETEADDAVTAAETNANTDSAE